MPLRRLLRSLACLAVSIATVVTISGCAKDVVRLDRNRPPRTFIVAAPVDSTGVGEGSRSSYKVHLYWRGEDDDGYVAGFLWAFDDSSLSNFHFTTRTDSTFELVVNDSTQLTGSTTVLGLSKYHTFFIRAIDNLGKPDPGIQFFNRRTFLASTQQPRVEFVGALPDTFDVAPIDTLSDGAPFQIRWRGEDPDGVVTRYKFDVGTYSSPLSPETSAYFNESSRPGAIGLPSGVYTFTVTGIDNANAVGKASFIFVVNHDPETWIIPKGNPIGHYIQYFKEGTEVYIEGTFAPGETVPYRSTVWWEWDAADTTGGETNRITGWSVYLNPGNRNNNDPYTIGFVDVLLEGPPPVRFTTNNPAVVGPAGFVSLILDSLDAGYGLTLHVRARDGSLRGDGTPAQFRFNCNYPPKLIEVWERDTLAVPPGSSTPEPSKAVHWLSYDYEDGLASTARLTINGTRNVDLFSREQSYIIPVSVFQSLNPGSATGGVKVRVGDRAGIQTPPEEAQEIVFPIP